MDRSHKWPPGYIDGLGNVPGGPENGNRPRMTGGRVNRLSTGSEAVIPDPQQPEHRHERHKRTVQIKLEDSAQSSADTEMEDAPRKVKEEDDEPMFIKQEVSDFQSTYENDFGSIDMHDDPMAEFLALLHENLPLRRSSPIGRERQAIDASTHQRSRQLITGQQVEFDEQLPLPSCRAAARDRSILPPENQEPQPATSSMHELGHFHAQREPLSENPLPVTAPHNGHLPTTSEPEDIDTDDIDGLCTCPTGEGCNHRALSMLDCRSSVLEYKAWTERTDEEAFDIERAARVRGERWCTTAELTRIVDLVKKIQEPTNNTANNAFKGEFRSWIVDMEDVTVTPGEQQDAVINEVLPSLNTFLSLDLRQLPRSKQFPDYIAEELKVLSIKWNRGDFSGNVNRGLIEREANDVNGIPYRHRLKVDTTWAYYRRGNYFGTGQLVNGQIFLSRVHLMRDGVHSPTMAGISGTIKHGAYSVVLGAFDEKRNEGYSDRDTGSVIDYVGTALPPPPGQIEPTNIEYSDMNHMNLIREEEEYDPADVQTPTDATRALMRSLNTQKPVRVIRSYKMCTIVSNKPRKGYRYDGLYKVKEQVLLKKERQIWSFRLVRCSGQGTLRGFAPNEAHPDSSMPRRGYESTRKTSS